MDAIKSQTEFLDTTIQLCGLCKLSKFETNVKLGKMTGFGMGKKYFMIGQNPSNRRYDKFGGHGMYPEFTFANTPEGYLAKCFDEVGLQWQDFYVTNLVKCSTPDNAEPDEEVLNVCPKTYLTQEYFIAGCPKKVICLGDFVYDYISLYEIVPADTKIYKVYHHSYIGRDPSKFNVWKEQFKKVKDE